MAEGRHGSGKRDGLTLELVGIQPGGERPAIVVQALGEKNDVLHSQKVGPEGAFAIPADVLKKASYVVVGAPEGEGIAADGALRYRTSEFEAAIENGTLALAEGIWSGFHFPWHCVSGSVRVCRRRPIWFDAIITAAVEPVRTAFSMRSGGAGQAVDIAAALRPSIRDILA